MRPTRAECDARVRQAVRIIAVLLLLLSRAAWAANPTTPVLFVTQVPMPEEVNSRTVSQSYQSCVSPFSNHLPDTAHAGRGGSLWVRFGDGTVVNLLAVADWSGIPGGKPGVNTIAVRNPAVNWTADKAIFSMVIGAPTSGTDATTYLWQLYEITLPTQAQLAANVKPVLSVVANQPPYNNIQPVYAPDSTIVFLSDRPYNGQPHLLQREEYLGLPTTTGLWKLDPASANSLLLLHHSPSGAFSPTIDSAGRLIFSNWDHLTRDAEGVTDSRVAVTAAPYNENFAQTFNGSGNFADEGTNAPFTAITAMAPDSWEIFPEPPGFDRKALIDTLGGTVSGKEQNLFMPWMINLDGTGGEIINHVGRHEIGPFIGKNFVNDANIVDLNPSVNPNYGGMGIRTYVNNFMAPREDPLSPGTFYGVDANDLGTHGAGQIVKLNHGGTNPDGTPKNPDAITITYVTAGANGASKPGFLPTVKPSINLPATGQTALTSANALTLYRTPLPMSDGTLVASHVSGITQADYNSGTVAQPATFFAFRLKSLKVSGTTYVPDVTLTSGLTINTSYYVGATQVSYNGPAWELDPVEVVARTPPSPALYSGVDPVESGVFATTGVHVPTFQNYLKSINAALTVSRNVTKRDMHDRQQPFNLKIAWSNTKTVGTSGTVYNVGWIQFLQADLRRGYVPNGTALPGRRVIATPMHDNIAENVITAGAPAGALRLGDDGSFAAIVPAGKALTWHLLDTDAAHTSQVKERFWLTFQSGEIRTCANCHGINTSDQTGTIASPVGKPTNPPQALATLLQQWKTSHPSGSVQFASATATTAKDAGTIALYLSRSGGSTGPVTASVTTADGTAHANTDYSAVNTTVTWADGDTATKAVSVPLITTASNGTTRTFSASVHNPQYGTLGATQTETVTLVDPPDTTPPNPPVVTQPADGLLTNNARPTFSGTAEANSTITLRLNGNSIGTALATGGQWSLTPSSDLTDGSYQLTATATDAALNSSTASVARTLTVDTTPPSRPTISQPVSGLLTNNPRPTISGTTEENTVVTVFLNGTSLGHATVGGTTWSLQPATDFPGGTSSITAIATDAALNLSALSLATSLTIDVIPPAVPTVTNPIAGTYSTSNLPVVTGGGDANTLVSLYIDGNLIDSQLSDGTGFWSIFCISPLGEGSHSVQALATDQAGSASALSTPVVFTIDTVPPSVPVISIPVDGSTTSTNTLVVTGQSDPGTVVTLTLDDSAGGTTSPVDSSGTWQLSLTNIVTGPHTLVATASDVAGNTRPSAPVTFTFTLPADAGTPVVDAGTQIVDAGTAIDAGTPIVDAGTPIVDAGTPVVDAGTPVFDAGTPVVDAGTPVFDAGTPIFDAGTPVVDAGTPIFDAGPLADAGTPFVDAGSPFDAGLPEVDAGTPIIDAGTPAVDAGTPAFDAGIPEVDAGTPIIDAGIPEIDAGSTEIDAGTPEVDAGTPITDAGTPEVDAGAPITDAGTPELDAGAPGSDAGSPTVDAGTPTVDAGPVGTEPIPHKRFGCESVPANSVAVLLGAILLLRRARRQRGYFDPTAR
jgi:hypothetical protein